MRFAFSSSVLPNPLVPMTMNLSSRPGVRKPSISGVRGSKDSSKSSATRMSSASTVHARMGPPGWLLFAGRKNSLFDHDRPDTHRRQDRQAMRLQRPATPARIDRLAVARARFRSPLLVPDQRHRPRKNRNAIPIYDAGSYSKELVRGLESQRQRLKTAFEGPKHIRKPNKWSTPSNVCSWPNF